MGGSPPTAVEMRLECYAIIATYGTECRGPARYYLLAGNVYRFNRVEWAMSYARRHRVVHVERPTFAGAVAVLERAGARVAYGSWDELLAEAPESGALWVTSPLRNPDGACLDAEQRAVLAQRARTGQAVVINGVYDWFHPSPPRVPGADVLGSLHKIAGHGARLGWVNSASYFDDAVAELIGTTPSPVWQRAWALFILDGGLDQLIEGCVGGALTAAEAFIDASGMDVPASPHLLLPLVPGASVNDVMASLARQGFRVGSGADFASPTPAVRVSFLGISTDQAVALAGAMTAACLFCPSPTVR